MKTKTRSYGKRIEDANVMLSGISVYIEKLTQRGIDEQYIDKFKTLLAECVEINNNQEKAKSDLKNFTNQLVVKMDALEKEVQYCKRVVKTEIAIPLWDSFGMKYRYWKRWSKSKPPDNPPDDTNDDNPTDNAAPQKTEVKNVNEETMNE